MESQRFYSYSHPTDVHAVRACLNDNALDLLAVGGENMVEVLQREQADTPAPTFKVIASFYIATTVRALAWSPRTISPSASDDWFLELVVAGTDKQLRLLLKSPSKDGSPDLEEIRPFGGGLSGHHKTINDVCFCTSETYQTHCASVGDDGLIMWNLYPKAEGDEDEHGDGAENTTGRNTTNGVEGTGTDTEEEVERSLEPESRHSSRAPRTNTNAATPGAPLRPLADAPPPQATAYIIKFPHPLHTISAHPNSASQFMVSDVRGVVCIVDWTKTTLGQDSVGRPGWRGHRVVELVDPRALADGVAGGRGKWTGGAGWKRDDKNVIGATYGSRWSVWDLRKLQGGKPIATGEGMEYGGDRFRWSPSDPHLFAISTSSPLGGASVKVYKTTSPAAPREYIILPSPHRVKDFDWLAPSVPGDHIRAWLAVAAGKQVFFVAGGDAPQNSL